MGFFQGFNFDTVLAIISCITGIVALFLGGTAYKNCRISKNSIKQKKEFNDDSTDNSITVGGDYNHNEGISETGLLSVMDRMNAMTSASFSTALDEAYTMFQAKCDDNLHTIMEKTEEIIKEQKLNLGGYSKIDWIHVYFESAKNASNTYMQDVWAKVLALELAEPGSFSFKTLSVLKSMSDEDFRLFETLCSLQINGTILQGEDTENILKWTSQIKLSEMGLLSLNYSRRWYAVPPNGMSEIQDVERGHIILLENKSEKEINVEYNCYFITTAATELQKIASYIPNKGYFDYFCDTLKKEYEDTICISLHKLAETDGGV